MLMSTNGHQIPQKRNWANSTTSDQMCEVRRRIGREGRNDDQRRVDRDDDPLEAANRALMVAQPEAERVDPEAAPRGGGCQAREVGRLSSHAITIQ